MTSEQLVQLEFLSPLSLFFIQSDLISHASLQNVIYLEHHVHWRAQQMLRLLVASVFPKLVLKKLCNHAFFGIELGWGRLVLSLFFPNQVLDVLVLDFINLCCILLFIEDIWVSSTESEVLAALPLELRFISRHLKLAYLIGALVKHLEVVYDVFSPNQPVEGAWPDLHCLDLLLEHSCVPDDLDNRQWNYLWKLLDLIKCKSFFLKAIKNLLKEMKGSEDTSIQH
jgi:hypothetical protein